MLGSDRYVLLALQSDCAGLNATSAASAVLRVVGDQAEELLPEIMWGSDFDLTAREVMDHHEY